MNTEIELPKLNGYTYCALRDWDAALPRELWDFRTRLFIASFLTADLDCEISCGEADIGRAVKYVNDDLFERMATFVREAWLRSENLPLEKLSKACSCLVRSALEEETEEEVQVALDKIDDRAICDDACYL